MIRIKLFFRSKLYFFIILSSFLFFSGCAYVGEFDAATRDPLNLAGGDDYDKRNDRELVKKIQDYYFDNGQSEEKSTQANGIFNFNWLKPTFNFFYESADDEKKKKEEAIKNIKRYQAHGVSNWLNPNFLLFYENADENKKKCIRNDMIDDLILLSDLLYEDYKHRLNRGKTLGNFFLDVSALALTGAATITGTEEAKNILTGLSGLVQGTNISINKNLYYEQTMTTILNVMDTNRHEKKTILLGCKSKKIDDVSINSALCTIFEYHHAGSAISAIATLEAYSMDMKNKQKKK